MQTKHIFLIINHDITQAFIMGRLVPVFDLPLVQGGLFFPVLFPGSLLLNFELVYCFSCCWNYHGFQPTLNYSPLTSLLLY